MALRSRARPIIIVAVSAGLVLPALAPGRAVLAADRAPVEARIAAVQTSVAASEHRDRVAYDAIWLLAQNAPAAAPDQSRDAILAFFDESTPETVEEEVAKTHGLEVVSRKTLTVLGMRMVRFRVPDARSVTDVIAILRADKRVASAQPNFRYRPLLQPREVSQAKEHPKARASHKRGLAATQRPGRGRVAINLSALPAGAPVARNRVSLRWPTADEPFVNVGMSNR
jgi:hypothetical protein